MANSPFDHFLEYLHVLAVPTDAGDDAALLERFLLHRDEAAFATLERRHGPLVLGVCRRLLRHEQDAEDAFQAAFLVLARKAGSIRNKEALAAWLYEVAYHIAARMRAENLRRNIHERQAANMAIEKPSAEAKEPELVAVLDEELNRLPEKYRRPLILCYLQGKTHLQAARELGLPAGSLSRRLGRARELLRERLAGHGFTTTAALLGTVLTAETLTAAVPRTLIVATAHAARLVTLGGVSAAMSVSARSIGLAETAVRTMSLARLKMTVVLLMLGSALGGAGLVAQQSLRKQPPERISQEQPNVSPEAAAKAAPAVRKDRFGDPLPSGAVARLGALRFRHEGKTGTLVFSPDGKIMACSTSGEIVLWDARSGKELRRWSIAVKTLNEGINTIQFSPDGRTLAGSRDDNHIGLWEAASGKLLRSFVLPGLGDELSDGTVSHTLRFCPDGKLLAVSGLQHSYVLDTATGKALHHFKTELVSTLALSPDGALLVMSVWKGKGSQAHELQVRSVRTGEILRRQEASPCIINAIAFSPDGKLLATDSANEIILWEAATGKVRRRIVPQKEGVIASLAFTPDGKTLLAGSPGDKVHVWDVVTGRELRQLDSRISTMLSPDGKMIVGETGPNIFQLFDFATGQALFPDRPGHDAPVNAVAYSPDGNLLVSAGENRQIWLWETATGKPVRRIRETSVRGVAFSPDGQRLALLSPGRDDYESGDETPGEDIRIREVATGKELFRLAPGDLHGVNALAYSPDGKLLVTADWKSSTGKDAGICNLSVWDASSGRLLRRLAIPGIYPWCLAFRGDGRTVAVGGADSSPIRLWDLTRGEEVLSPHTKERDVLSLAFSPDGRTLVSGGVDRVVRLWEVATGKEILALKGHPYLVAAVAFSPDGRIIASGDDLNLEVFYKEGPKRIRLWDAATGEEIQHFQGHNSSVLSHAFSPDGARLASGLRNGTVLLWEVPRGGRRTRRLTPRDLGSLWTDLAGEDARRAYAAIRALTDDPGQAVAFLMDRLCPVPQTDAEQIRRWIADLDSDEYAVRQMAMKQLAALGEQAGPLLRERLGAKPPLEVRKRIEELLSQMKVLHAGEVVRGVRAMAVLEQIGTSEARRLLERLAQGAPEARLTREAKASLKRLAKQPRP
jgi:RNA polymerase sigma factor (sigma-70 family)